MKKREGSRQQTETRTLWLLLPSAFCLFFILHFHPLACLSLMHMSPEKFDEGECVYVGMLQIVID